MLLASAWGRGLLAGSAGHRGGAEPEVRGALRWARAPCKVLAERV